MQRSVTFWHPWHWPSTGRRLTLKKTKKELEDEIDCLKRQLQILMFHRNRAEEKNTELVGILQQMRGHHNVIATLFERCTPGEDHARNR
jgi:hypothetical protein